MIEIKQLKRMYEIRLTTKVGNGMVLYAFSQTLADGLYQLRHSLIGAGSAIASVDLLAYSREQAALNEAMSEVTEKWQAAIEAERAA